MTQVAFGLSAGREQHRVVQVGTAHTADRAAVGAVQLFAPVSSSTLPLWAQRPPTSPAARRSSSISDRLADYGVGWGQAGVMTSLPSPADESGLTRQGSISELFKTECAAVERAR